MTANLIVTQLSAADVAPGGTLNYRLLVQNTGDTTATGIEVVDTLPTDFTITNIIPGGNFIGSETSTGVVTFTGGTLTPGKLIVLTIQGTASQGATGSIQNVAVVDPNNTVNEGVNENDNTDTVTTTINDEIGPDLRILQIDSPDPVAPGDTIFYSLLVSNNGPGSANSIEVRDTLPTGFTVSRITPGGSFTASQTGNVISFTGGSLASGKSTVLTIVGTSPTTAGEITNIAVVDPDGNITESDETNNIVSGTTTLDTALLPDLNIITLVDTPDPIAPGGTLTYQLIVKNNGPGDVSDIVVRDTLDANFNVTQITPGGSFLPTQDGNVISFSGGSLSSGELSLLTIVGTVPGNQGTISNIAVVDPDNNIAESNDSNNTVTETTTISVGEVPDLTISQFSNPSSVIPGDTIFYHLLVSNNGPGSANSIVVRDSLPSSFTVTRITPGGDFIATQAGGVVSFTGGSLLSGESTFFTIVGTVSQDVTGDLINTAAIDPDGQILENNEDNNTTTFTTTVSLPDLTITKVGSPNFNLTAGDTITYQLSVSNDGVGPANSIVVRDTLPNNFLDPSITSGGGFTSSLDGGVVTFSGGSLTSGESATFTIVGRLAEAGQITNTAVVDPDNSITESNFDNNTATFTVAVASPNLVFVDDDWSSLTLGTSVDPDGAGTEFADGDGTIGINAFSGIGEGVSRVASSGTVRVFAGTYGEIVGISKPVSLIGPNASINPNTQTRVDEATITGTSAGIAFLPGATAGQVIIDGFRLEGAGTGPGDGAAIDTTNGGANTTIRNNVITNVDNDAIRNFPKTNPLFDDTSNLVIENNRIDTITGNGNRRGIFLQEVNGLTVTGNVVRNITGGDNPGISIDTVTGNVLVQNNTLTNIASQGIQVAGIGSAGGTVTITGNVLTNVNAGADGTSGTGNDEDITNAGIRLRNSPGAPLRNGTVSVTNNRIENTMNGLVIRNPADANVVTVSGNFFVNTVANPGGSSSNFSFGNLSPGTYAIINGGINTLNAAGNFEDLLGTDALDLADVAGSVTI